MKKINPAQKKTCTNAMLRRHRLCGISWPSPDILVRLKTFLYLIVHGQVPHFYLPVSHISLARTCSDPWRTESAGMQFGTWSTHSTLIVRSQVLAVGGECKLVALTIHDADVRTACIVQFSDVMFWYRYRWLSAMIGMGIVAVCLAVVSPACNLYHSVLSIHYIRASAHSAWIR